ncbi:coiled-coil domain-containing protein 112-like [Clavelina lepadiformis]|uniref:coiled-coil domain-containing protein 112-like n=1 Tax=Clavelina lepadiformis TaxID=159417 RepID=UPI004042605D
MADAKEEWKAHMNAAKNAEFFKELEHIKFQSRKLEREKIQSFSKRADYRPYYKDLDNLESSLNDDLRKERFKIDQHLAKIKNKVKAFKKQLKDMKATPEFVDKLRDTMEDIEVTINDFKQQQKKIFETLLYEENNTNHEIEIAMARIETISSSTTLANSKSKVPKQAQSNNLPPEVKDFEKYVSQYGNQGGWDDYDHSTFLKIRNKMKGKPIFIRSAVENIPGRSYEDIKDHEQWYRRFCELRDAKKTAILEWKLNKENDKEVHLMLKTTEDEDMKKKIQREKEQREEIEREKKKKELQDWKARKAEQTRLELEEIERTEMRKRKLKEKEQLKMAEIRDAARERLQMKKDERERERWRLEAEQEERRALKAEQAQMEIARFQSRDQKVLEQKQKQKQRKEEEVKERAERLRKAKAKIKLESDRNRLYQPTDAWIQRNKQRDQDKSDKPSVISMPHRAVPNWRQGL